MYLYNLAGVHKAWLQPLSDAHPPPPQLTANITQPHCQGTYV